MEHNESFSQKPKSYYLNLIIDNNDFSVLCDDKFKAIVNKSDSDNAKYFSYDDENNRAILIDNTVYNYRFIEKKKNQYKLDSDNVLEEYLKDYILEKHKDLFKKEKKPKNKVSKGEFNISNLMWRVLNTRTPVPKTHVSIIN